MKVRITVSTSGKTQNVGKSNSITINDAQSVEEIKEAIDREFSEFFPKYQKLGTEPTKKSKKE